MSLPRINLAQPCYGTINPQAHLSYGQVVARMAMQGILSHLGSVTGAYLDTARNILCRYTLEWGDSHLLFMDQDMVIPTVAVDRLIAHEFPVVGALYFSKDHHHIPVLLDEHRALVRDLAALPRRETMADYIEGSRCACEVEGNHVHEAGVIGMGLTLIEREVLERIDRADPGRWFELQSGGREDVFFADQCRKLGIPIMVDGMLHCGHVREEVVCIDHYQGVRAREATLGLLSPLVTVDPEAPTVLDVGGEAGEVLPAHYEGWRRVVLNVKKSPGVDIVADITDPATWDGIRTYEEVRCAHTLEHLYAHQVPVVLGGFRTQLVPGGAVEITVPNLDTVFARLANGGSLDDVAYLSPRGEITYRDMLYGLGREIAESGEPYYAHKTGFTKQSLAAVLEAVGYEQVEVDTTGLEIIARAISPPS